MIILRKQFSEKKNKTRAAALTTAGGAALIASNIDSPFKKVSDKLRKSYKKNIINDSEAVNNLLKGAKEKGTKVLVANYRPGAAYLGSSYHKELAKELEKAVQTGDHKLIKEIKDAIDESGGFKDYHKYVGKDAVVLDNALQNSPETLAHELGHANYMRDNKSKNILAKLSHKTRGLSSDLVHSGYTRGASFLYGLQSGYRNEKKKQKGKKTNLWEKTRATAIPVMIAAPLLMAEGSASLKGLRLLKDAGASKEVLGKSRKQLAKAWGTYGVSASRPIISGVGGELAGRGIAKITKKSDKDDNT